MTYQQTMSVLKQLAPMSHLDIWDHLESELSDSAIARLRASYHVSIEYRRARQRLLNQAQRRGRELAHP